MSLTPRFDASSLAHPLPPPLPPPNRSNGNGIDRRAVEIWEDTLRRYPSTHTSHQRSSTSPPRSRSGSPMHLRQMERVGWDPEEDQEHGVFGSPGKSQRSGRSLGRSTWAKGTQGQLTGPNGGGTTFEVHMTNTSHASHLSLSPFSHLSHLTPPSLRLSPLSPLSPLTPSHPHLDPPTGLTCRGPRRRSSRLT